MHIALFLLYAQLFWKNAMLPGPDTHHQNNLDLFSQRNKTNTDPGTDPRVIFIREANIIYMIFGALW